MKNLIFCTVLLMLGMEGLTQNPAWTDPVQRKLQYPETLYLTGFSSESIKKTGNPDELRQKHLGFAKSQLVETIQTNISSSATLNLENLNTQSYEHFKQASVSTSEAQLYGLKTETCYDTKKKTVYAFAYIKIADLIKGCTSDLAEKRKQLKSKLDAGDTYVKSGDIESALKTFNDCYPMVREIENDEAVLVAIGKEPLPEGGDDYGLLINQRLQNLRKERVNSLDDLCLLIADGLKQQLTVKDLPGGIQIGSFTFQNTRMGSEFSVRFAANLEQKIVRQGITLKSHEVVYRGLMEPDTTGYVLSGTYWKEGENIKIIVNLRHAKTGRNIASVQEFLPEKWCNDNAIKYIADNYNQAVVQQKQFSENEITGGGLFVDLWTNRGKDNPVFTRNDTMRVYVKVDQPCYIRLIYYLSDGRKTLLADSRYINEDQSGKPLLLPDKFVCDAPFGVETIQLIAQTSPFKPLSTRLEGGYQMIEDDTPAILANVRGMKTIGETVLIGEKRLVLTTYADK